MASLKKNDTSYEETCVCPNVGCGRSFDHPLRVTVLSSNPVETYPACPYCMSKIEIKEAPKLEKNLLASIQSAAKQQKEKEETKSTAEPKCSHSFGYLKSRPKGASIPDECLVCQKMIQCLS